MRTTMLSLTAAAACLTLAVGCSQNSQVVRSQGPAIVESGDYCDECDECDGRGCRHCTPYRVPGDLVYPPPGDQPAIVQYPYYTNKGPDCFFHK
jgi:hypothetical protein